MLANDESSDCVAREGCTHNRVLVRPQNTTPPYAWAASILTHKRTYRCSQARGLKYGTVHLVRSPVWGLCMVFCFHAWVVLFFFLRMHVRITEQQIHRMGDGFERFGRFGRAHQLHNTNPIRSIRIVAA